MAIIDTKNFSILIKENNLKFYKTAKAILKNDDDTYDALQNALISMYEKKDTLENEKYFATWGIRIVINKCYDFLRKNKNISYISLDDENYNIDIQTTDEYDLDTYGLDKILKGLHEDIRLIITLYYYDDLSVKDISIMLNVPEGTVKSRLSKARNILKEKLKKEEI